MVSFNVAGENYLSTFIPEDTHRQVLGTCIDVPEEYPSFPLPLNRVGISGKTVWVRLADNKGGHLPFAAFTSLPEYGKLLGSLLLKTQNAQYLLVELIGHLPLIQKAPVSRLHSIDTIEVRFKLMLEKNKSGRTFKKQVGAAVHHLTACPCTLSYNEVLFKRFNDPWPQSTHSQRSKTQLFVSPPNDEKLPTYKDLTDILDSALHISQDLLKRPDETELVLKAHKNPQFAEDTVREVARAAGEKFKTALPPETRIKVHSLSLESIHIHDVECTLDTELGDILATLQSTKQE
jgi:GTP cyclohydrolase FolE2